MPLVTRRTSSSRQVAAAASIRRKRLQSANTTTAAAAAACNTKNNDDDDKVGKRSESFHRLVKLVVAVIATLMIAAIAVASLSPPSSSTSMASLATVLAAATTGRGEGGMDFLDVAEDVVQSGPAGGGEAKNLRSLITADPRPIAQSTSSSSSTTTNTDQLYPFYSTPLSSSSPLDLVPFPTIPHLEHCQVTFQPPPSRTSQSEWRTPLWAPSYPSSGGSGPNKKNGGGDLIKALVERLTGHIDDQFHRPVKNYHSSIRNGRLKRCKGISETVLCTQGHPIIPVEPMKQTDNFQSTVIVPIRNPAVAFPVSVTDKAIAYHSLTGQVPEKEWLSTRDSYLEGSMEAWKNLIQYWQGDNNDNDKDRNSYYHVGLFVPWEDLMDIPSSSSSSSTLSSVEDIQNGRGPKVVQKLAMTLQKAGFDVATSVEDTTCIWYQVVQHEWQRQQDDVRMSYLPSYTMEQQKQMVDVLRQFQREEEDRMVQAGNSGGDSDEAKQELLELLNRYIDDIQNHLRLDVAAAATT